jgi:hypothetical protein
MALSPNYGWAEPDNSSLVKNGAQDIRALGDAIDTSVWNVGYGQAAKNKIINGDFSVNQRNFTSNTTNDTFNFDRWTQVNSGGSFTVTPQTFTTGAAPVAGYEGSTFIQGISAGQSAVGDNARFRQKIESVRTFAGQTATISFYAKAATGTPKIGIELAQEFGTGGGPSPFNSIPVSAVTISTNWVRYTATIAVPSLSGKTVGTDKDDSLQLILWVSAGSTFATRSSSIGIQNNTFQIWGVQVEYGSKATPFQTASGGSSQAELAMCQRYYFRHTPSVAYGNHANGGTVSTTQAYLHYQYPVQMRRTPTSLEYANVAVQPSGGSVTALSTLAVEQLGLQSASLIATTASTWTNTIPCRMINNNNSAGYVGFSAEL